MSYPSRISQIVLAIALVCAMMDCALAQSAPFGVGDRVTVGSTGESGIVIEIGGPQATGGTFIKVHLDRFGSATSVGVWYDSVLSKISAAGGSAQPPASPPPLAAPVAAPSAGPPPDARPQPVASPGRIVPGVYECYALTSGRLSPRLTLNIDIVDDSNYRDAAGGAGTYTYDASSGAIAFSGGGLEGQQAKYAQPSNPPTARNPPTITYVVSGDSCDLKF